ncbi:MAG: NAD-dependent deacylase [Sediminibacterium sp.]|nr:NAD-dependent deacylase [Sediminibacterium sp.]MBX9780191.1 NAD-dependent deacylase [Chitinophagaceae bacterium]
MSNKTKIVVLSGAGISAESGLRTFRDSDGLWEGYNVYEVATPGGWAANMPLVLDFYNMRRRDVANAKPNAAHTGLAELEKEFDVTIITQNIDDLHERGGSTNVLHLHGEIFKMCSERNKNITYEIIGDIKPGDLAPDGAQLRPFIVWFEEEVPLLPEAAAIITAADIFVVIGTSLQVYPAASLIHYAPKHAKKFIIDKKIPPIPSNLGIEAIEATASEGVLLLKEKLLAGRS